MNRSQIEKSSIHCCYNHRKHHVHMRKIHDYTPTICPCCHSERITCTIIYTYYCDIHFCYPLVLKKFYCKKHKRIFWSIKMSREIGECRILYPNGLIIGSPISTTLVSTATVDRIINLPDVDGTLVINDNITTLSNKLLDAPTVVFTDVTTGQIGFSINDIGAGNKATIQLSGAGNSTITVPNVTSTLVNISSVQTLQNKIIDTTTTSFQDVIVGGDIKLNVSSLTSGNTLTLATSGAGANTLTIPSVTDTLVARNTADTLTNKILNSTTNDIAANSLRTAGGNISALTIANIAGPGYIYVNAGSMSIQNFDSGGTIGGRVFTTGAITTNNTAAQTTIETIPTADGTVYNVESVINGRSATIGVGFTVKRVFQRLTGAGSLAAVGLSDDKVSFKPLFNPWDVRFNANTTTGDIEVQVNGSADSGLITWKSSTFTFLT